jgi:hypothetical protein
MSDTTTEEKPVSEAATPTAANVRDQSACIDESEDRVRTACDLAAEPWQNETLRLRAIVFLVRSGTRLREMEHAADAASVERERMTDERERMTDEREREIRRHEEMRANDREHAEENRRRALIETLLPMALAAHAEGKNIDFSSALNSALEFKKLFDLILKP